MRRPAPELRAVFLRSWYTVGTLLAAIEQASAAIRREGLRPDVEGRKDVVWVYARPRRNADTTSPAAFGAHPDPGALV